MKKNVLKTFLVVFACASLAACSGNTDKNQANKKECDNVEQLNQNCLAGYNFFPVRK